ncbi:MAG: lysine--tRNA ligase [Acidobacteria bacterium]|nr:lysine--tRNA ligase [Acidobacteriota bacterium]
MPTPLLFEPHDQLLQRQKKLQEIQQLGHDPYPHRFEATHSVAEVVERHGQASAESLQAERPRTRLAGRILSIRFHGKTGFADLYGGGARLQAYFRRDQLGEKGYRLFELLDLGDVIGVEGHLGRTKTGELTVFVAQVTLLAKALLPLPEKWHGLADVEQRYRQRYLDLIVNPGVRQIFETRARIIAFLRRFLEARGFLEVETPMMQLVAGGATARPFLTHHQALDLDLYLRIAPELYLKRLVVGGFDRVFEINRNFRNEGLSVRNNPEFTMLEFYQAYADYRVFMDLSEEMLTGLAENIAGSKKITYLDHSVDFSRWQRLSLREAICEYWLAGSPPKPAELAEATAVRRYAEQHDRWAERHPDRARTAEVPADSSAAVATGHLFEAVAERQLIRPTIVYDFPTELSPLAKQRDDDPTLAERFEIFAGGLELGNAFSELSDPLEQHARFLEQLRRRERGDLEAHQMDEDYVRALAYGMPPTAGEGIGVDRLTMLLTNTRSIREVILFPLLRPLRPEAPPESDSP